MCAYHTHTCGNTGTHVCICIACTHVWTLACMHACASMSPACACAGIWNAERGEEVIKPTISASTSFSWKRHRRTCYLLRPGLLYPPQRGTDTALSGDRAHTPSQQTPQLADMEPRHLYLPDQKYTKAKFNEDVLRGCKRPEPPPETT